MGISIRSGDGGALKYRLFGLGAGDCVRGQPTDLCRKAFRFVQGVWASVVTGSSSRLVREDFQGCHIATEVNVGRRQMASSWWGSPDWRMSGSVRVTKQMGLQLCDEGLSLGRT